MDLLVGAGYLSRLLEDAQGLLISHHNSDGLRALDFESTLLMLRMPAGRWRQSTSH